MTVTGHVVRGPIEFYVPESPLAPASSRFPAALLHIHEQPSSLCAVVGASLSLERAWSAFSWPFASFSMLYRRRFMSHASLIPVAGDSPSPLARDRGSVCSNFRFSAKIHTHWHRAGTCRGQQESKRHRDEKQERTVRKRERKRVCNLVGRTSRKIKRKRGRDSI